MSMDNSNGQSAYDPLLPHYEKPNWGYWETVTGIKLWEAVSLAVNIDPRSFYSFGERKLDKFFNRNQPPSFTKLLALALANIAVGGVLKPPSLDLESPEGFEEAEVKIARFVKWAKSLNLELPAGFPGTTRVALAPNVEIQLDGSERSSLLALIAMLADQAKIDISQSSKAAGLIQSLVECMGVRISVGAIAGHLKRVSSRNAKPLGAREETTLLVLIAALCKELNLDISNPSRAAEVIEGITMRKGTHIAATTIEEFLKRVPTALAKRAE